ncbi:hypothetical protein D9757_000690 [Collybiopsis confluens]|uniref:Uncharacterized protein n=1 Tax=Collybiopsis confluens TaxID=2823264 RepID=A0A8H5MGP4_9AGAR|nr:hypothetical protein D9757_000690 [Collybiopsis confluens]
MDYAAPTQLASVDDSLAGHKLELSGKMMSYDPETGFVLLWDKDDALLVDVALCLDRGANTWIQTKFVSLTVIGHLEKCLASVAIDRNSLHPP